MEANNGDECDDKTLLPIVFTDQADWMQFKNLPTNYVRDEIMVMFLV
jgi:hypothetical protein